MSLESDARVVTSKARTFAEKRDRIARRILGVESAKVAAYREVFLEGGELSPAALIVLDDIARLGRLDRDVSMADEATMRRQATVRAVTQHIFGSFALDPRRLQRLVRQLSDRTAPSEKHALATGEQP